ncbi:putative p53-regulating kinase [Scheffersomyces coipomensis]|uniref:putative p53-regulating kinase n=1 Tax=Scheffersomyces coipomensis TaxID=1788519 RepID=UPI00315CA3F2
MGNFPKLPEGTDLPVGTHKVKVLKYLSEGGFAHIYKVKIDPPEDDSDIACLKRVIVPDKAGLNLLRKEVDVMKTLRHGRNIVKYYDSHAERLDNGTYQVLVVMELCPNKSLLDYMNAHIKTRLSEREILKIMLDISVALYEMHRLKMIHRDVKIENVLIDSRHDFKLCDFGSTSPPVLPPKDQQAFQLLSHDILYHTTPQYRAPEMIDLYRGWAIDEKADIWALGCFLFKLCYYTTPFEANGDIAILHASFQFPHSPIYSGDLKNLIIIMLQESPLFRPNIIQVLMLICSISAIDFKTLKVEDIYHRGPYNFQALHSYQRQKQAELLKQQEVYLQQQAHSLAGSKNPSSVSLVNKSFDSSPVTPSPSQANKVVKQADQAPQLQIPEAVQGSTLPITQKPLSDGSNVSLIGTQTEPTTISKVISKESDEDQNSDLDFNDLDDLGDLSNAEERYPSLDDLLDEPLKVPMSNNEIQDGIINSPVTIDNFESKRETSNSYAPSIKVSDSIYDQDFNISDNIEGRKSQEYPELHLTEENLKNLKKSNVSENMLDKKENWIGLHSKMDKSAEQLVDDIFSSQSKSPMPFESQPQKTNQSSKSENSASKSNIMSEDESHYVESKSNDGRQRERKPSNNDNEINLIDLHVETPILSKSSEDVNQVRSQINPSVSMEKSQTTSNDQPSSYNTVSVPMNIGASINMNPFPFIPNQDIKSSEKLDSQNQRTSSSNPWGTYRANVQPVINNNDFTNFEAVALPTDENNTSMKMTDSLSNKPPKEDFIEPNLIDLEIGLESSGSSLNTPVLKPRVKSNEMSIAESGMSLLDLNTNDENDSKQEIKQTFKKRIPSNQNPTNLNFQEEVIDFASDDENPENGSNLNRLKIRNSLKKPPKARRSGEYKRNESVSSEGKKRLSFFGGSS